MTETIENAKMEARRIIENAQEEAKKILSESALLKAVKKEAERLKEEIKFESIFKYKSSEYLLGDLWKVQELNSKKYALFHSEDKQLTDFKYSMIERFEGVKDNHFLIGIWDECGVNTKFGIINETGDEIIPMIYTSTDKVLEEYKKLI